MGGILQGAPAVCRALAHSMEEMQGQDSLEGCHEVSDAMPLSSGLGSIDCTHGS